MTTNHDDNATDIRREIAAALNCCCLPADDADTLPDLQWQLSKIMNRVKPCDLKEGEIKAMIAILAPVEEVSA